MFERGNPVIDYSIIALFIDWFSHPNNEKVSSINDPKYRSSFDVAKYDITIFLHALSLDNKDKFKAFAFDFFLALIE